MDIKKHLCAIQLNGGGIGGGGGRAIKEKDLPKISDGTITWIKSAFVSLQKFILGTAE